ncbi:MAG TPA: FtsX-like permease family protein [Aliidongia sp.]|uniref:FtsX-like permease family protein n=1 Tax=Aliidongia sp. TaxID=1914230 RepID=UPI002DDD6DBE|nr:FtsX-like permease family protein [Aliidongia sp.]HEV2676835.1 FtsX-like permease family protein [Aliidongia sp.]
MFSNYLSSALGNLLRNRLHAAINLFGLALGLATAILIGLYIRDEVTFERFLPDYQQTYRLHSIGSGVNRQPETYPRTPHEIAAPLRDEFPEVAGTVRLMRMSVGLRHDAFAANEDIMSVDPNFFSVLGYRLLRGDPATALARPDALVLTRAMALKYFGTVECVGKALEIDQKETVRVTGVMDDLPSNTHLYGLQFLLSGLAPFSELYLADHRPPPGPGSFNNDVATYVRLKPGASAAAVDARLPDFMARMLPTTDPEDAIRSAILVPIDAIHLHGKEYGDYSTNSDLPTIYAITATGVLVLLVAGINFVNLVTARATRRAVEVGVRKAAGATQRQLIAQFMGESVAYGLVALILAVALVELVLPSFNGFLDRTIGFAYWREPALLAILVGSAVLIGLAAGIYPALVLSSFRPAVVLKGAASAQGAGTLRQVLVVLQYAISITLLIATAVIRHQTEFATSGSLHFDKDLIVAVELGGVPSTRGTYGRKIYDPATVDLMARRIEAVPGVKVVGGSWVIPDARGSTTTDWTPLDQPNGKPLLIGRVMLDFGFFESYGIQPVAGRLFGRDYGIDKVPVVPKEEGSAILNESAVRAFGFASPQAALGHEIKSDMDDSDASQPRRIVGVVPDFPLNSIRTRILPTVYLVAPDWSSYLNVKLTGENVPAALAAIDRIWQEMVPSRPIQRQFIDARVERLYRDVTRQGQVFTGFALVAVLIACLGLFGLAAFTAERRTKEIGIRKAMGASTGDILKLLLWEFAKPVLLANAIAWPVAYVAMSRWLDGFAYRIDLDPLVFLGAGVVALVIASATTLYHALQVARSRPVLALRYE